MDREKLIIFDTTLRDGEQTPGYKMYPEEKLEVAKGLAEWGVDVIEAGFPISAGDFEGVHRIAQAVHGPTICGLARCVRGDIEAAGRAIMPAIERGTGRIHTFIATSPQHIMHKLRKERKEIINQTIRGVRDSKEFTDDVEYSCEDFGRTELDYAVDVIKAAIEAGATTINLPDTVGYCHPEEVFDRVSEVIERVNAPVVYSVHAHNDQGLAVANSLAAIRAGCRQVEGTVNGIGERAGNASLEEVILAVNVRDDVMPVYTDVSLQKTMGMSKLVQEVTKQIVQRNKAVVGENAGAHSSGIHQDGMLKDRSTYEIFNPADYGNVSKLPTTARSGKNHLVHQYQRLGINPDDETLRRFKVLATTIKDVYDDTFVMAAVGDTILNPTYTMEWFHPESINGVATAEMSISSGDSTEIYRGSGKGMIDAAKNALVNAVGFDMKLVEPETYSMRQGSDSVAEYRVLVEQNGFRVQGLGYDEDTVTAAAKAFMDAANKIRYIIDNT